MKEKHSNCGEEICRHHLNPVIKVNISSNRSCQCHVLPAMIKWYHHLCDGFPTKHNFMGNETNWGKSTKYQAAAAAAAKSRQSCRTLCDPIDGSPPGYYSSKCQGHERQRKIKKLSYIGEDQGNRTAECNLQLDLGMRKGHQWENCRSLHQVHSLFNSSVLVLISLFW